jgi:hypothetical protein
MHADRAVLVQNNPATVQRLHCAQIIELKRAVVLSFDDRLLEGLRSRSTDVEGTHRQLRAGFTDGLRGDNADSFTELHELTRRQVTSVAMCTDSAPAFTG